VAAQRFAFDSVNYYDILGVARTASPEEIRAAYREAVRRWHPDINPAPEAREHFLLIRQAYEVLSNPEKRQAYDQTLDQSGETQEMGGTAPVAGRAPLLRVRVSYALVNPLDEPQLWYAFLMIRPPWSPPRQPRPLELWLLLDRSSSMLRDGKISLLKSVVRDIVAQLRPTDRLGLVAFDDRAELLLRPTPVHKRAIFMHALEQLKPRGATEIAHALRAVDASLGKTRRRGQGHTLVWIFTDGRTYGDEGAALRLARQWARQGVICDAFGMGKAWNEAFLDRLTGITGGTTHYLDNLDGAQAVIRDHLRRYHHARVRQLYLHFDLTPGVRLHTLYRMSPEVAHLGLDAPIPMGTVGPQERWLVLAELELPPLYRAMPGERWKVMEGRLEFLPFRGTAHTAPFRLEVHVEEAPLQPPPTVVRHAVERLTWYRLQMAGRTAWRDGRIEEAQEMFSHLAQSLARRGLNRLARHIQHHATTLLQEQRLEPEVEKALEFGTRMLMLPANVYEARKKARPRGNRA